MFVVYQNTTFSAIERDKMLENAMKRVNDSNTIGGLGCMICGADDIQIFVTLNDRIAPDSSFADLMKSFDPLPREAVGYGLHYEPLETYHQALWRAARDLLYMLP